MRLGEAVEWGIHCCTVLAMLPDGETLPAARLAEFHGVPPAYLAKHLQALARAGVLESLPGAKGGYRLTRPAHGITLLEVVEAVEGPAEPFECAEIRQRGPAAIPKGMGAYRRPCGVTTAMRRAEDAYREALAAETIGGLVEDLARTAHPEAAARAAEWYGEIRRPARR